MLWRNSAASYCTIVTWKSNILSFACSDQFGREFLTRMNPRRRPGPLLSRNPRAKLLILCRFTG
jgi:hypothetical protein